MWNFVEFVKFAAKTCLKNCATLSCCKKERVFAEKRERQFGVQQSQYVDTVPVLGSASAVSSS